MLAAKTALSSKTGKFLHMRVLYARLRYVGMSPAQAARGGDVGGAPGA